MGGGGDPGPGRRGDVGHRRGPGERDRGHLLRLGRGARGRRRGDGRRGRHRQPGLRGAAIGAAGVVRPPVRSRCEPGQHPSGGRPGSGDAPALAARGHLCRPPGQSRRVPNVTQPEGPQERPGGEPGGTVSEPARRGAAWTDERGAPATSEEGRRRLKSAPEASPGGTVSEPAGRGAVWTDERGAPATSEEGRRRLKSAPEASPGGTVSEPAGRGAAWTDERGAPATSEEGRRRLKSAPEASPGGTVNLVPGRYRSVSVASVPVPPDEASLRAHLVGRPAYRHTRYIVARSAGGTAVVEVVKRS